MNNTNNSNALAIAEAAVVAAGFTPCPVSSVVRHGTAFAFSDDREGFGMDRSPVFSVAVDVETGAVTTTGAPRSWRRITHNNK